MFSNYTETGEDIRETLVSPPTDVMVDNNAVHMSGFALRHDPIFMILLAGCISLNASFKCFLRVVKGHLGTSRNPKAKEDTPAWGRIIPQ